MSKLTDGISVRARFARSANLERDLARSEPLDGYVVTARALDVVERMAETAATGTAGGAWSLTGPYGSGKSSLALLIDAACQEPRLTGTKPRVRGRPQLLKTSHQEALFKHCELQTSVSPVAVHGCRAIPERTPCVG